MLGRIALVRNNYCSLASMFRAPQWHGATQTHFPPRPRKSQWHCNITNVISPHGLPIHQKQAYHMIPQIIPLTSDTPRSTVAWRHANALSIKAAQIAMALRHHDSNFATRSVHTLEAFRRSTHTSRSPAKQFRASSPSKQHPRARQSQCHSDIHLYRNSQQVASQFPAPATNLSASPCLTRTKYCACHEMSPPSHLASNLTIPCACHEIRTSAPQNPHKVLRLPRKVTISCHVSFNRTCTTPHVWNDFDPS